MVNMSLRTFESAVFAVRGTLGAWEAENRIGVLARALCEELAALEGEPNTDWRDQTRIVAAAIEPQVRLLVAARHMKAG